MSVAIRWNPAHNIFALDDVINQMLEWPSDLIRIRETEISSAWVPAADVYETNDTIIIELELTGVDKSSLEILFQDEYLFLQGKRPLPPQMQSAKIHRIERLYGHFQRVFQIPQPVDVQHVSASYQQGVLKIMLAKFNQFVSGKVNVSILFE
jgi:HSP20 family protein